MRRKEEESVYEEGMGSRGDRRREWRRWVVEEEIRGRGGEKI